MFCAIVAGATPAHTVYADEHTLAFLDVRPVFPGHVLLVPRDHHETLTDLPPALVDPPPGCSFHPRCRYATERCSTDEPPLYDVPGGRASACHYWEEVLAK